MRTALIGVVVAGLLGWFGFQGSVVQEKSYSLTGKASGYVLTQSAYPRKDFQIEVEVEYTKPGSILDTVGINAAPVGAWALQHLPVHVIGAAISVITLLFGLLFLTRVRIRFPVHPLTEPAVGLLSGMLGGSISESGPPVVIYGLSREWAKDVFRSSLLAYFLCLAITAAISYSLFGMVSSHLLLLSAAGLLPALAAGQVGVWLKQRIPESAFRAAVLVTVVAVGMVGLIKHLR